MAKKKQTALQIHDKLVVLGHEHDATLKCMHSKDHTRADYNKMRDRVAVYAKQISDLRDVLSAR